MSTRQFEGSSMTEDGQAEIVASRQELVSARIAPEILPAITTIQPPAIVSDAGERASRRFAEFFTVNIENPNTRRAYYRNAVSFLDWCEQQGYRHLRDIEPMAVAGYIQHLKDDYAKPSIKQSLATIRMLFDWLVVGQVVDHNPAHAVRGPKHVVNKGLTPVLNAEETKRLLESIPISRVVKTTNGEEETCPDVVGLRDRALISAMFFTFARVGAVVAMDVEDYYPQGKRWWLRLQEKGGKQHEMPAHHTLEEYLDAYIQAAAIADERKGPLFRSCPRTSKTFTRNGLSTADVWRMIQRRARKAGIATRIGCHSFRATGITNYLEHDGTLEKAQQMASHSSPRTTKLYDRTDDRITLDEVEKIKL
jgi:site-specific recombinase XerD